MPISDVYVKTGNHESFSGNEGKDMKQRNFFIVNKKQYTVPLQLASRVQKCYLLFLLSCFPILKVSELL